MAACLDAHPADSDVDENSQLATDELLAMDSIFGEEGVFAYCAASRSGVISVSVRLDRQLTVEPPNPDGVHVQVDSLPAVSLEFSLPAGYPGSSAPVVRVVCSWMTPAQMLRVWSHLQHLWQRSGGACVLFDYVDFIGNDLLSLLHIESVLDLGWLVQRSRAATSGNVHKSPFVSGGGCCVDPAVRQRYRLTLPPTGDVRRVLATHQRHHEAAVFRRTRFTCAICSESALGGQFLQLSACGHVFCRQCLAQFYSTLIRDGSVHSLRCPQPECTHMAAPSEVRELVDAQLYERYDSLLLSSTLGAMSDVALCPRSHCQCVTVLDERENMGHCSACGFVFCSLCHCAYHGVNPCNLLSGECERLIGEYKTADASTRELLERRHGKRRLRQLLDESAARHWMQDHAVKCPRCCTPIEKIDGCNKMTCRRCGQCFCWLCGQAVSQQRPYEHFNLPDSPCYQRLFSDVPQEDHFEDNDVDAPDDQLDWQPLLALDDDSEFGIFVE